MQNLKQLHVAGVKRGKMHATNSQLVLVCFWLILSFLIPGDSSYIASNKMHDINGYVYGNQPRLRMCKGELVSWHIMSGILMHAAYFYGNTVLFNGRRTDVIGLIQGEGICLFLTALGYRNKKHWLRFSISLLAIPLRFYFITHLRFILCFWKWFF